ncbi:MAG: hypothetical protein ACKV2Q_24490 [Planctomycetaceae bacterium]
MRVSVLVLSLVVFVQTTVLAQAPKVTTDTSRPVRFQPPVHVDPPLKITSEDRHVPSASSAPHQKIRLIEFCSHTATLLTQTVEESDLDFAKRCGMDRRGAWEYELELFREQRAELKKRPQIQKVYEIERINSWLHSYQQYIERTELEVAYLQSEVRNNPNLLAARSALPGYVNALNSTKSYVAVLEARHAQLMRSR